jgi:hypothetical protein
VILFDDALQHTHNLLAEQEGIPLTPAEKLILNAAWNDITFAVIAEGTKFTETQLRTYLGVRLWSKLSNAYGESIKKKTYRKIVEERLNNPSLGGVALKPGIPVPQTRGLPPIRGGQPSGIDGFVGRSPELAMLRESCNVSRCVVITGPTGIGKSSLVSKFIHETFVQNSSQIFECCILKGIHYQPPMAALLEELLLNAGIKIPKPTEDAQLLSSLLIDQLRARRCLLVLDACEAILRQSSHSFIAEYNLFFRRFVEEQHQGCLILISQEPLPGIRLLENKGHSVRSLTLSGLGEDALHFFKQAKLSDQDSWGELIQKYRGNPLALKMVAKRIKEYFGGSVKEYLKYDTTWVLDPLGDILTGQLSRLSSFDQVILQYLAKQQERNSSVTLQELAIGTQAKSMSQLIDGLDRLEALFLIEKDTQSSKEMVISMPPVVLKFMATAMRL